MAKKRVIPTPKSGGDVQLKGFDARDRIISSASGGTVTATQLTRPGKHVPADPGWKLMPPDHFEANRGPQFRTPASRKGKK